MMAGPLPLGIEMAALDAKLVGFYLGVPLKAPWLSVSFCLISWVFFSLDDSSPLPPDLEN